MNQHDIDMMRKKAKMPITHELLDEIEKLREALKPFAQEDLIKKIGGCSRLVDVVYQKDNAKLYLGDFQKVYDIFDDEE